MTDTNTDNEQPAQTTRTDSLVSALIGKGFEKSEIDQFLADIEVPADLHGLGANARKLRKLVAVHLKSKDPEFKKWVSSIFRITNAIGELPLPISEQDWIAQPTSRTPTALRSYYESNPAYCLLAHGVEAPELMPNHNEFLIQFLWFYKRWKLHEDDRRHLYTNVCRAARRLGKTSGQNKKTGEQIAYDALQSTLRNLPAAPTTPDQYALKMRAAWEKIDHWNPKKIEVESLRQIMFVVEGAVPDRRESSDEKSSSNSCGSTEIIGGAADPIFIKSHPIPGSTIVAVTISYPKPSKASPGSDPVGGLDPIEVRSTKTFIKVKTKNPIYSVDNDPIRYISASNRASALASTTNNLALDCDSLNSWSIKIIIDHLESVKSSPTPSDALIAMLFGSGLPLQISLATILVATSSDIRTEGIAYRLGGKISFPSWSAQQHMKLPTMLKQHTAPHQSRLTLYLATTVSEIIDKHVNLARLERGDPLFGAHDETQRAARQTLELLNGQFATTLTLCRISGFLYRRVANLPTANEAAAIALTGQPDHGGFEPATYMESFIENLSQILKDTWNRIGRYANLPQRWTNTRLEFANLQPGASVGSRIAPLPSSMNAYLKQCQQKLRHSIENQEQKSSPIEKHLNFARLVYSLTLIMTGSRSVCNPLPHNKLISINRGWFYTSTKDSDSYYHAHVFPISKWLQKLFENIQEHNEALLEHWFWVNKDEALAYRWQADPPIGNHREKNMDVCSCDPRILFLIEPTGTRQLIGPAALLKDFTQLTGSEENAFRHYFCSRVEALGCPSEIIRALMSHWRIGEEPWSRYSALDPVTFRRLALKYMDELISELGIQLPTSPFIK